MYKYYIRITSGCNDKKDCSGETADTCNSAKCRCGNNDQCSHPLYCSLGQCVGTWLLIFQNHIIYVHIILSNTKIIYKYKLHILLTSECSNDKHCSGESDKCISNVCYCGSKKKCSGTADTCTDGNCTCGGNSECSSEKVCYPGGKCINGEKV